MKQSTKKIKKELLKLIGGIIMLVFTTPPPPLAARDNQPARPPYNPVVEQSATATVLNKFEIGLNGKFQTIIIADVDGDGRPTDDQRVIVGASDWFKKNPSDQLEKGDGIVYIENINSITRQIIFNYTRANR
jgi:hypothetical protein